MKNLCYCGKEIHKDRKYCSFFCRSNDKEYRNKISSTKLRLYSDPKWKMITENKKVATTFLNHGVSYPMQKLEIFERQQAACFEKDEIGLHGYEPYVFGYLKQIYTDIVLGTHFLKENNLSIKWMDLYNKEHRSYPDFFCPAAHTFIEIKSNYTRKLHNEKLMRCRIALHNMRYGYVICVVNPNKSFSFESYNTKYIRE